MGVFAYKWAKIGLYVFLKSFLSKKIGEFGNDFYLLRHNIQRDNTY